MEQAFNTSLFGLYEIFRGCLGDGYSDLRREIRECAELLVETKKVALSVQRLLKKPS
jgi:hypothetical protein